MSHSQRCRETRVNVRLQGNGYILYISDGKVTFDGKFTFVGALIANKLVNNCFA